MTDMPAGARRLDDNGEPEFLNWCAYSYPGAGKTVLAGSGGKGMCILDSDLGTTSARAAKSSALVVPATDYTEMAAAVEWLKYEAIPKGEVTFVWWDGITLFQERGLMDDIMLDAVAQSPRQDRYVPSKREYMVSQQRIGELIRQFAALPVHFGVSAHVMAEEDPEGEIIYMPQLHGKNMASKLCGYMNVVTYLAKHPETGVRRLITEQGNGYFAKDRFHALRTNGKPFVEKPTIPKVLGLIDAKRAEQSAAKPPAPARRRPPARATSTIKEK